MGARIKLGILVAITCAVVGLSIPATAQVSLPLGPSGFSSTALNGQTPAFSVNGSNNATITIYTGGGATFTIVGAGDAVSNATYNPNIRCTTIAGTTISSGGVVANPSNNSVYSCSLAGYPLGFKVQWAGNTGTVSLQVAISNAVSFVTPSPLPSSAFSCGGNYSPAPVPTQSPVPTPNNCYIALGGIIDGPTSPGPYPRALFLASDANHCLIQGNPGYSEIGASSLQSIVGSNQVPGVGDINGASFRIGCDSPVIGEDSSSFLTLDAGGNLGIKGTYFAGGNSNGVGLALSINNGINFPASSNNVNPCLIIDGSVTHGITITHSHTGDICTLRMADLTASSVLCTDGQELITTTGCSNPNPAPSISASPPIVANYNGGTNTYNVSCPTCSVGSGAVVSTPSPTPSPMDSIAPANTGYITASQEMQSAVGFMFHNSYTNINWLIASCGSGTNFAADGLCFYNGTGAYPTSRFRFGPTNYDPATFQLGIPNGGTSEGQLLFAHSADSNVTILNAAQNTTPNQCWNQGFSWVGTAGLRICTTGGTTPDYQFDTGGRLHIQEGLYGSAVVIQPSPGATAVASPSPGDIWASESNTTGKICIGGNNGTSPSNGCSDWNITKANAFSLNQPLWLTSSKNKGQVSCSVTAATSCTATATIINSAVCNASIDSTATTTLLSGLTDSVAVSGTTLTVTLTDISAVTGTLAADYICI